MDVLLFSASSLGAFLQKDDTVESSRSLKVALVLSLCLLSLSILETAPSQWMVFLDREDGSDAIMNRNGSLTLSGAYRILLWIVCLWVVVILPGNVGGHIFRDIMQRRRDHADDKKDRQAILLFPWWIRYTYQFLLNFLFLFYRLIFAPIIRMVARRLRFSAASSSSEPILISHSFDKDSRHGTSLGHRRQQMFSRTYLFGGFCGVMATIIILRTIGPLVIHVEANESQVLSTLVSWLCAIGLLISSVINGFGCVSMPHSCLVGWSLESIHPETIARAEVELQDTKQSMQSKIAELRDESSMNQISTPRRKPSSFPQRKTFADYSEEVHQRKLVLQKEIDFLDVLVSELQVDISEMKHSYDAAVQARTPMGQFGTYLGFIFSVVLLVRLFTATMSVLHQDTSSPRSSDPITTSLLWLTGHNYVSPQDYNRFSQGISLLLTACLSVSQVRTLLRTISSVNKRLALVYRRCYCASGEKDGTDFEQPYKKVYALILAALMGCYFVSCVVLTKMNLPIEYRSGFAAALGVVDFTIKSSAVNLVFALSTAVSAAVLGILVGIQRQNTKRYAQEARNNSSLRGIGCV